MRAGGRLSACWRPPAHQQISTEDYLRQLIATVMTASNPCNPVSRANTAKRRRTHRRNEAGSDV
jgi:hypothetical protein